MSANVKKAFAELYSFLEANSNKKVSTILPEVLEMVAKSKNSGSETGRNFVKDEDGNVVAVFCYYHKRWELIEHVPYGKKASNQSTGLNTMCKQGVSNWTKQQREYTKAKDAVLESFLADDMSREHMQQRLDEIAQTKDSIVPLSDDLAEYTADTVEELLSN